MDIIQASDILGIDNLFDLDKRQLSKIYKKLMLHNHPDRGGKHDISVRINTAYEVLKDTLEKLAKIDAQIAASEKTVVSVMVTLKELVDIYKGGYINARSGEATIKIDKRTIRYCRVYINIDYSVSISGQTINYNKLTLMKYNDEYELVLYVPAENTTDEIEIKFNCYGKEITFKLKGNITTLNLSYDGLVKLKVVAQRKIADNSKD